MKNKTTIYYSLILLALSLVTQMFTSYNYSYYVDEVALISLSQASLAKVIFLVFDGLNDLIFGYLSDKFSFKELTLLAIATSIDAFAVGITYAVLKTDILIPIIMIGLTAFIFTIVGLYLGKKIGNYFGDKFEILGGVILILLGVKILLEGLGILVL